LVALVSRLCAFVLVILAGVTSHVISAHLSAPLRFSSAPPTSPTRLRLDSSSSSPPSLPLLAHASAPLSSSLPGLSPSASGASISPPPSAPAPPPSSNPSGHLGAAQLALIINAADPLSVKIGAYYAKRRHIPQANILRVSFDFNRDELPPDEFTSLQTSLARQTGKRIQAYALTWARPYRVGCMSITAAFAFGYDTRFCAKDCSVTLKSPYFNSGVSQPYNELGLRPTMSIAALDFDHARTLIDHGVRSDGTRPSGTAYLVIGDDKVRNARAPEYPLAEKETRDAIAVNIVRGLPLTGRSDVMFYFTGAETVPEINTNRFLPGAVADHLTSFGGMLTDSPQMSSLRWLEAGATGSYGTVVEPCAFPEKFPNVTMLMSYYTAGETLIEAYWKSVQMPGQGIFIGEPLATPFRPR
jgi:uncharacterized protein (TIGR03790 family)